MTTSPRTVIVELTDRQVDMLQAAALHMWPCNRLHCNCDCAQLNTLIQSAKRQLEADVEREEKVEIVRVVMPSEILHTTLGADRALNRLNAAGWDLVRITEDAG
jgi:hypothetical protein